MFTTARIRLTIWYLLIIMLISIMFSLSIYRILTNELERSFHRLSDRYVQQYAPGSAPVNPDTLEPLFLQTSEDRIKWTLIYINLIILGVSGVGGYILAGVTLKPIRHMIDEQNRFITDASHELRTPITALRSEIEVYLRAKKHTVHDADELLQSNLEEVNNLQVLSDSLIELAQLQKPPKQYIFTSVALREVLETSVKKLQKAAKLKNITLSQESSDTIVIGDKESLIQLFSVLIDNAIKYSPEKTTVTLKTKQADSHATIEIIDQGIGIEKDDIPHIFDRFYRADTSRTKQEVSGYGLGLSIAKKIVTEHHGSIHVTSTLHKGTIFFVQLPLEK